MKMTSKLTLAATLTAVALMGLNTTHAGPQRATRDPGVNARQHEQQERIQEGVRSGELTPDEAKGLRDEERGIRKEERAFKSDGKLTADERAKLNSDLNKTSKDIYAEKHDAEVRKHGPHDPVVNARQHNQRERIAQGVRSGELTKDEAKGLRSEEKSIRVEERQFKSDGKLTAEERAKLNSDLNKTSKDIYIEKHDAETRTVVPPQTTSPPVPIPSK